MEVGRVSLDGDRLGLGSDGSHDCSSSCANRSVTYNASNTLALIIDALTSNLSFARGVWIIGFGLKRIYLGVLPGFSVISTVTTVVALEGRTVNEVLLRQLVEGAVENSVCALHGSSCGESPT